MLFERQQPRSLSMLEIDYMKTTQYEQTQYEQMNPIRSLFRRYNSYWLSSTDLTFNKNHTYWMYQIYPTFKRNYLCWNSLAYPPNHNKIEYKRVSTYNMPKNKGYQGVC